MFSLVAHGWNIDIGAELIGSDSVRFFRGVGTVRTWMFRICTLLGPEGPGLIPSGGGNRTSGPFLVGHDVAGGEGTARTL